MGTPNDTADPEWRGRVYRESNHREIPAAVKARVRARDGYRCQVTACSSKRGLECHHIIPVIDGGQDDEDNMILLCKKCHDEVEDTNLRTRLAIREYIPDWYLMKHNKTLNAEQEKATGTIAADWHSWVYGGGRNPRG